MAGLTVALVGCGSVGRVHLARWLGLSGVDLISVCDTDAASATRIATEYGVEGHTDWHEVFGASPDIVDICTPPDSQAAIAEAAIAHGANVLCETPMGRSVAEARKIAEAAEAARVLVMPAFCHRFSPQVVFVRELIDNDDLGRVVMLRSRLSGHFPEMRDRWTNDPEVEPTGVLLDTTLHSVDLFRYLVEEVDDASGSVTTFDPAFHVPDSAAVVMQGANGAIGIAESSWSTPGGRNVLEVYGTAGACVVDYDSGQVRYRTADMAVWETREAGGPDRFLREMGHFADAVRGLQPPAVGALDALKAHEVIDRVRG